MCFLGSSGNPESREERRAHRQARDVLAAAVAAARVTAGPRLPQGQDQLLMSFDAVEDVLGVALPAPARTHFEHWYGYDGTALGRAIRDAGWKATGVDLAGERVVFRAGPLTGG